MIITGNFKEIKGNRINLRLFTKEYESKVLDIYTNNLSDGYLDKCIDANPNDVNRDFLAKRLRTKISLNDDYCYNKNFKILAYVIFDNEDNIIGIVEFYQNTYVEIEQNNKELELGIFIDKKYSSKGFGKEAITLIIDFIRNNTNCDKLIAQTYSNNIVAINITKQFGFNYSHEWCIRDNTYISVFTKNLLE